MAAIKPISGRSRRKGLEVTLTSQAYLTPQMLGCLWTGLKHRPFTSMEHVADHASPTLFVKLDGSVKAMGQTL